MINNNGNFLQAKSFVFYISESFGTFMLAYSITSCSKQDTNGNQTFNISIFLLCLTLILSICNILGTADLNPAVSYLKYQIMPDKKRQQELLSMLPNYIILQYSAAIMGFYLSYQMNDTFSVKVAINPAISQSNAFFMETYASFVLYLVIAVLEHTDKMYNQIAMKVFATVFGVGTGIAMGSTTSGAGLNPAIALGANFVRFLNTGKIEEFKYTWLYTIGPYLASSLVGNFYNKIYNNPKFYKMNKLKLSVEEIKF